MQTTTTATKTRAPHRNFLAGDGSTPWLRLLPEDGWLTLGLLVVLVYTTIASIQGAWQVSGLDTLTLMGFIGLLFGYLAVQQGRLPGVLVHTVLIILGILIAFKQTADAVVAGDRGLLWKHTRDWFQQAIVQRGASNDNTVFLLFLAILSFLLAYISVWLVLHTRRPWLAALANGIVLMINLNAMSDDRALFFLVLFVLTMLLLLVRFTLAENVRHWRMRGLRFSPDLGWDFMQAGAIFTVVVLLLAYLLPMGAANKSILDYWNSPRNPWQTIESTWQNIFKGAGGNGNGGNGYGFFGDSIKLQGKVTLPKDVILRYTVPTTGDGLQYLMTETYDTYDSANNTWTNSQTQANNYKTGDVEPLSPGVDEANYKTDTYAIVFSYVQGGHLFSPGSEPVTFSVPAVASVSSAAGVPVAWNANAPISAGTTYYSQGYISTATEDQLRAVPYPNSLSGTERAQLYQTDLLNEYLPNTPIPQDVAQKALDATKGTTNMYDAAVHLTDYLRVFTYSLDNPNPPQGQDAISWFLNYRQGFCTYFASAMAIMGRSLGMPTRIVAGFAHGTYDSASHKWIVRGTDSHVWTQIYFGKYGWINFEPTSSFDSFARAIPGTGNGTPTPTVNGGGGGTQASPVPTHGHDTDTGNPTGPLGTTGASSTLVSVGLLISLLIIFALLCLFLFATWWRLIYRGLSPITAAFARVTRLGAWAGAPPGKAQTPDEYAEQLGRILPGQRRTLQRLSDIYARERWGGGLRDDENAAVPTLYDEVRTSVTPIILRRLRHLPAALLERLRRLTRGRGNNRTDRTDW